LKSGKLRASGNTKLISITKTEVNESHKNSNTGAKDIYLKKGFIKVNFN